MKHTLFFTNTLTNKKETFVPLNPENVRMYSCGLTVYNYAHIGNFRAFLFADLLRKVIVHAGYQLTFVQNITDVGHLTQDDFADGQGEDKMSKSAKQQGKTPAEVAQFFTDAYHEDAELLGMSPPDHQPRATQYISEQIKIAEALIEKGMAYESNGSVYFRVKNFPNYGELSGNTLENLLAGARVEINDEKESPLDFALWKKADASHIMQWDSPWGKGFPGWHIECSAMSRALLGEHFDIHTGGEDNIFPHHECEIAQNEGYTGKKSVNYWLHSKHLLIDGEKMSKSQGNFYTVRDLISEGWAGEEIRYSLMNAHYRSSLNFTKKSLHDARATLKRIREAYRIFSSVSETGEDSINVEKFRENFWNALSDDLNFPKAMGEIFSLIGEGLKKHETKTLSQKESTEMAQCLAEDVAPILNLTLQPISLFSDTEKLEIEKAIKTREICRTEKNWEEADRIRVETELRFGIELIDVNGITEWRKKI